MASEKQTFPGMDAFTGFWTDFLNKMSGAGVTPPPQAQTPDFVNQMRKAFFEAMSQNADQFMRSEAFLNSLKHSMDNALAWQQMMNDYMQRSLAAAQMPSRADSDHVVLLVRGLEERVLSKLDAIAKRVEALEAASQDKKKGAQR